MGFKLNVQLNCTAEVSLDGAGQQDKRELGERDMAKGNGTGSGSRSVAWHPYSPVSSSVFRLAVGIHGNVFIAHWPFNVLT